MRETVGLIVGAMKPMTNGHFNLIKKASADCDKVRLYVSTGDRIRPGELAITWKQMTKVWRAYLTPMINSLGNVQIFAVSAPMKDLYDVLIAAEASRTDNNSYVIYSDITDLQKNFKEENLLKKFPRLMGNDQIILQPVDRAETAGISGTKMREAIAKGNFKLFVSGLPEPVQKYGKEIFEILRAV